MPTPHREKILQLAEELWVTDQYRNGCAELAQTSPEYAELLEGGYVAIATSMLMRKDRSFESYLEREAEQNGYRLIREEEHDKIIECERARDQLRAEKKRVKRLEAELEETRSKKQKEEIKSQEVLPLDLDEALRSGLYACGTTGVGKSDIGMYAASLLIQHGVIIVVFDGSQDWIRRSKIPNYFTIQPYTRTDIPQQSLVYDISFMSIREQQILVEDFCKRLMKHQAETPNPIRKQYFLIFEEAHTYFPEGCMRAKRYQNTVKMMTQGRNYKVRFMAITQFSSLIDKTAMRYMKQRYFGATDEPNDVNYVTEFLAEDWKEKSRYAQKLKGLKAGQFLYKNGTVIKQIQIEPFSTEKKPMKLEVPEKPIPEPMKPKPQYHDNAKVISSVVIALMWLIAIIVAVKPT